MIGEGKRDKSEANYGKNLWQQSCFKREKNYANLEKAIFLLICGAFSVASIILNDQLNFYQPSDAK